MDCAIKRKAPDTRYLAMARPTSRRGGRGQSGAITPRMDDRGVGRSGGPPAGPRWASRGDPPDDPGARWLDAGGKRPTLGPDPGLERSMIAGPPWDHPGGWPLDQVVHPWCSGSCSLREPRSTRGPSDRAIVGATGPQVDRPQERSQERPGHAWTTRSLGRGIDDGRRGPPRTTVTRSAGPRVDQWRGRPGDAWVHVWSPRYRGLGIHESTGGPADPEVSGSGGPRVDHRALRSQDRVVHRWTRAWGGL